MPGRPRCAVVGAGIIGICCGIELVERGFAVTLFDPAEPGSMTSKGNAGGFAFTEVAPLSGPGVIRRIPGWLLDPLGPLFVSPLHLPGLAPWLTRFLRAGGAGEMKRCAVALRDLLRASMRDAPELIRRAGLEHLYVDNGAVTVYRSRERAMKDRLEWDLKRDMGISVHTLESAEAVNELEPGLRNAGFGFYTPRWSNTPDPFVLAKSLAAYFIERGGAIRGEKILGLGHAGGRVTGLRTGSAEPVAAERVVIAAGAWSGELCRQAGERVLLAAERGYNVTLPRPGVEINRQVVFGEEKFVASAVDGGLRIGGASEFTGLDAPANYRRADALLRLARRYLPRVDDAGGVKWMGARPATPDSLPVIGRSGRVNGLYHAFGHGHLGLTMAATTGKLVAGLVMDEPAPFDLRPFSIDRFN